MRHHFGHGRAMRIPLDGRLGVALIWLSALILLGDDSLDGELGIAGAWSLFLSAAAVAITVALLHAHSRRVVLEVMSWEHRQLADSDGNTPLQTVGRWRPPED